MKGLRSAIIGIDSSPQPLKVMNYNSALSVKNHNYLYAFSICTNMNRNRSIVIRKEDGKNRVYEYQAVNQELRSGDTIMIVLNNEYKTMRVYLNGYVWGVFIDNIIFNSFTKYSL